MRQTVIGDVGGGVFGFRTAKSALGIDASMPGDFLITDYDRTLAVEASSTLEIALTAVNAAASNFNLVVTAVLPKTYAVPPPIAFYVDIKVGNRPGDDQWRGYRNISIPPIWRDWTNEDVFSLYHTRFGRSRFFGNRYEIQVAQVQTQTIPAGIFFPIVTSARGYFFVFKAG